MRRLALTTAAALAAVAAGAATARAGDARPVNAADRALLARPATNEETIAQQVARRLTRVDASVRCSNLTQVPSYVLGVTPLQGSRSFGYFLMRPAECTYLAWFRGDPRRWDPATCESTDCSYVPKIAMALAVVSHESYHLLGYKNEAQVECYGLQSIWFVANKLGAPVAEAQEFGQLYATRMYPTRRYQSPAYWSSECRNGGKYDLRPQLASWPS